MHFRLGISIRRDAKSEMRGREEGQLLVVIDALLAVIDQSKFGFSMECAKPFMSRAAPGIPECEVMTERALRPAPRAPRPAP